MQITCDAITNCGVRNQWFQLLENPGRRCCPLPFKRHYLHCPACWEVQICPQRVCSSDRNPWSGLTKSGLIKDLDQKKNLQPHFFCILIKAVLFLNQNPFRFKFNPKINHLDGLSTRNKFDKFIQRPWKKFFFGEKKKLHRLIKASRVGGYGWVSPSTTN